MINKTIATKNDILETLKYFGINRARIEENIDLKQVIICTSYWSNAFHDYIQDWAPHNVKFILHNLEWWECRFEKIKFKRVCEQKEFLK